MIIGHLGSRASGCFDGRPPGPDGTQTMTTKFDLVVNLTTARALEQTIRPSVQATQVIH